MLAVYPIHIQYCKEGNVMKKATIALISMLLLGITNVSFEYQYYKCPYDGSHCLSTGKVDFINGKMFKVLKCLQGHYFHVRW